MNLGREIQNALRRQDPPEGFAERVVQQAGPSNFVFRQPDRRRLFRFLWPSLSFAAAAAAVVFSVSVEYRHTQEERAGHQAILALRIASEKLNMARDKILNQ